MLQHVVVGRSIKVDGKTIKAQIWDTAGQERYRAITNALVDKLKLPAKIHISYGQQSIILS